MLFSWAKRLSPAPVFFLRLRVFSDTQAAKQIPSVTYIYIGTLEVQKLLANLNPSKAAGPDNLSPRVLKELSDFLPDPLVRLFCKSLASGHVPMDWKHANVITVFKNGQKYLCSNYCPISLTCVISKIMELLEHIICSSLMSHAAYR